MNTIATQCPNCAAEFHARIDLSKQACGFCGFTLGVDPTLFGIGSDGARAYRPSQTFGSQQAQEARAAAVKRLEEAR